MTTKSQKRPEYGVGPGAIGKISKFARSQTFTNGAGVSVTFDVSGSYYCLMRKVFVCSREPIDIFSIKFVVVEIDADKRHEHWTKANWETAVFEMSYSCASRGSLGGSSCYTCFRGAHSRCCPIHSRRRARGHQSPQRKRLKVSWAQMSAAICAQNAVICSQWIAYFSHFWLQSPHFYWSFTKCAPHFSQMGRFPKSKCAGKSWAWLDLENFLTK